MNKEHHMLERIYRMTGIPICCYDSTAGQVRFILGHDAAYRPFDNQDGPPTILSKLTQSRLPFIEFQPDGIAYGAINGGENCAVIVGPIALAEMNKDELRQYALRHNLNPEGFRITRGALGRLESAMATLHQFYTGECITESEVYTAYHGSDEREQGAANAFQTYRMDNTEEEQIHLNHTDEVNFVRQIQAGDVEGIIGSKQLNPQMNEQNIGRLAFRSIKQFEYMLCSAIVIVSRAVLQEGVDSTISYAMSDLFFQRLEQCTTIDQMIALHMELKISYATLVKRTKEDRSKISYVEKSKVFIANHLNKPFSLDEIANSVGVNKSYLSRCFSAEVGMGIKRYTHLKRIEAACNMLRYSNESLGTIAHYLCFNSQSHFGQVFKQFKGVTPQVYRNSVNQ